jgi:hypothetical protein
LNIDVNVRRRGESGVNFLARIYSPDVWFGDVDSVCDIARQLAKLHLTTATPATAAEKATEKAISFYLTDANTPVIGDWARRLVKFVGVDINPLEDPLGLRSWNSLTVFDNQYPNSKQVRPWAYDLIEEQMPGFDVGEWKDYLDDLDDPATIMEDFLSAPCCWTAPLIRAKRHITVNGDHVPPLEEPAARPSKPKSAKPKKVRFDLAPKAKPNARKSTIPKSNKPMEKVKDKSKRHGSAKAVPAGPKRGHITRAKRPAPVKRR